MMSWADSSGDFVPRVGAELTDRTTEGQNRPDLHRAQHRGMLGNKGKTEHEGEGETVQKQVERNLHTALCGGRETAHTKAPFWARKELPHTALRHAG